MATAAMVLLLLYVLFGPPTSVFLKPFFRGVRGGVDLDVLGIVNLLAGVEGDKDGHPDSLS